MHIDDLAALMDRYRQGKCSPEEKKIIEEWYDTLQFGPSPPDEEAVDISLDKVFRKLQESEPTGWPAMQAEGGTLHMPPGDQFRILPRDRSRSYGRVMAAADVVALTIGFYWVHPWSRGQQSGGETGNMLVSTVSGEFKKMVLSDGSIIQLNANSVIQYPKQFSGGSRQAVLLSGEAFFQIAPDPAHPFIVNAGGLRTKVLGTSFNIRSYAKDSNTVISLITGKIQVSDPNGKTCLSLDPHDMLRYGKASGNIEKGRFDKETEVDAWKQRAMNFQDASFDEIAFEIENMYNVPVINRSNKKHWSYTGYFGNESVWEIVRTICITENLNYQFYQGHIILINKN